METAARTIREQADICWSSASAAPTSAPKLRWTFLPGAHGTEVLFLGNDMSPSHLAEILARCEGRELAVNVISKSGSTTEPAIAFRLVPGADAAALWQRSSQTDLVYHGPRQWDPPADV